MVAKKKSEKLYGGYFFAARCRCFCVRNTRICNWDRAV